VSIPPHDRRPTERIEPVRPAPVVDERVVAAPAVDPNLLLLRLEDTVDSLRTWLLFVAVLALAALGVALYAVLSKDDGAGGNAASSERVARLDDRVDRLSRQVQAARSGSSDTAGVADRVSAVERTVKSLAERPAPADATQAIEQLSGRIDALSDELKQAATAP